MKWPEQLQRQPIALLLPLLLTTGCTPAEEQPQETAVASSAPTGLELNIDLNADTDVTAIQFVIDRVSCGSGDVDPLRADFTKPLEDLRLSGKAPEGAINPLDDNAGHIFADLFISLPPGCYDVLAQPLNADAAASANCLQATATSVSVLEGQTTEILLLHQCEGADDGSLDTAAVVNHPPVVRNLVYSPSKFVFECEITEICATASDPDNDPIEFIWEQVSGPPLQSGITVLRTERAGNIWTQCVMLTPSEPESIELEVTVYDLGERDGAPIRFEDLLDLQGDPMASRDSLRFPLHASVGLEFLCFNADTNAVEHLHDVRDTIIRGDGCAFATPEEVYCAPDHASASLFCPGGQFDPSVAFPRCPE